MIDVRKLIKRLDVLNDNEDNEMAEALTDAAFALQQCLDALESEQKSVTELRQARVRLSKMVDNLNAALGAADDFINYVEAKQMTYEERQKLKAYRAVRGGNGP